MTLYRTMLFFNNLFTEYGYHDFDPTFITKFCQQAINLISKIM